MTEMVLFDPAQAQRLFGHARPASHWRAFRWRRGRAALEKANRDLGLALSADEIDYLLRKLHARSAAIRPTSSS